MRIGTKLGAGFLAMLALVVVVGAVGFVSLRIVGTANTALAQQSHRLGDLLVMKARVARVQGAVNTALGNPSAETVAAAQEELKTLDDLVAGFITSATLADPQVLTSLQNAQAGFDTVAGQYIAVAQKADSTVYPWEASVRMATEGDRVAAVVDYLTEFEQRGITQAESEASRARSTALDLTVGLGALAAVVGAGLAYTITRSITRPLAQLVTMADRISLGELDAAIQVRTRDEVGELAESLERMRVSLKAVIDRLRARPA